MTHIEKLLFLVAPIAWSSVAFGVTMVAPNGNVSVAGNAQSPLPTAAQSIEFQQVVGSGQFNSIPITITGISFRAAPGTGPINGMIGNLSVTLSTSSHYPNSNAGKSLLSSTFANNVGPDKTLVFSENNFVLKDSGCAAPGPCPFDINIVFQTPFVFSATAGALLIDLVATNLSATSGILDAAKFNAPGGSVATVIGAAGSATGTFAYQGNVVQITYSTSAPVITGAVNVASNIPPGMPNYGIAQGSLFAVYGSNMGPSSLVVSTLPLPTTAGLSGTTLTIATTGAEVAAPIYFTRDDIVVAVMPSTMPPGDGVITLTYNGGVGYGLITVVPSNFGISNNTVPFTNNGIGVLSTAAVTFPNYQPVTTTNTAKPGDILTVWGTGLGATPGSGGDSGSPPGGNIGPAPQVFIGGIPSPAVSYWGRAPGLIPGLDQINFQVPANAPLGCNVSIVVQTANGGTPIVSNAPTLALAATDGATCSDPTQYVPASALSLSSVKVLDVAPKQAINITGNAAGPPSGTLSGRAEVDLFQLTQAQLAAIAPTVNVAPSFGSCQVGINANPSANGPFNVTPLDAGPSVTLTPPSASAFSLSDQSSGPGFYRLDFGSAALPPGGTFTVPSGTWSFSDEAGGPDMGPLTFTFPVPQPVAWTNRGSLIGSNINRINPLTISWSGGDSIGYVDIQGYSQVGSAQSGIYFVGFECAAPVAAGQFTIPSSILLAMPPNALGSLQLSTVALPNTLGNVPGIDAALNSSQFQTSIPVTFK